jgi:hypothetical protein
MEPSALISESFFIHGMQLSDEAYERIILFTKKRASNGELDFTFSDLQKSFPDLDAAEILAKIHLLKDEWVINEVSPNCFSINKILLDPLETGSTSARTGKRGNHQKTSRRKSTKRD